MIITWQERAVEVHDGQFLVLQETSVFNDDNFVSVEWFRFTCKVAVTTQRIWRYVPTNEVNDDENSLDQASI